MEVYSESESKRFGIEVYRLVDEVIDVQQLKAVFTRNRVDLLIYRIPVSCFEKLHQLAEVGVNYLVTDVLVYYYFDLSRQTINPEVNHDLTYREVREDDREQLWEVIEETFKGYTNHYSANPLLDRQKILDGYAEWALGHMDSRGKICFVAMDGPKIAAFAACSYNDREAEGVIFGVLPAYAGRKIYTDLIRHSCAYFQKKGYKLFKTSTQIQNMTVQKVWIKEHFLIDHALVTIHFNNHSIRS